ICSARALGARYVIRPSSIHASSRHWPSVLNTGPGRCHTIILRTSPFLRAARSRWDQGFLRRLQTRILLALAPPATALHVLAAHVSPGYLNVPSSFSWKTWESCPSTSYQSPFPGPRAYRPFPVLRACRAHRHHDSSASSWSERIQNAAVTG